MAYMLWIYFISGEYLQDLGLRERHQYHLFTSQICMRSILRLCILVSINIYVIVATLIRCKGNSYKNIQIHDMLSISYFNLNRTMMLRTFQQLFFCSSVNWPGNLVFLVIIEKSLNLSSIISCQ